MLRELQFPVLVVMAGILAVVVLPIATLAATRPATEADLEWMKFAGHTDVRVGVIIDPDDRHVGKTVGEAKAWLAKHAEQGVKIRCLNPEFAVKLRAFMEAVPGGPPVITSGYRSQAEQQAIINRGDGATQTRVPCESYHPYGLAADFNKSTLAQRRWMRANANAAGFRTLRESFDPNHYQWPTKVGQCGGCTLDGPDGVVPPAPGGTGAPTSGLANRARQALGMQQRPQPQQQPIQRPPLPQSQSPLQAFNQSTSTNANFNQGVAIATTSAIADRLEQLAFGTTTPVSATSIPIVINPNSAVTIVGTQNQGGTDAPANWSPGINSSQTFLTEDLNRQVPVESSTGSTLTQLKNAILALIQYLKPFGGYTQSYGLE